MATHEEKIELLRKYAGKMATVPIHIKGQIPYKENDAALIDVVASKMFMPSFEYSTIIGFCDTTLAQNGKNGYIFTDTKVYYLDLFEKPEKCEALRYDEIKSVDDRINFYGLRTDRQNIQFNLYDGSRVIWSAYGFEIPLLVEFFNELLQMQNGSIQKATVEEGSQATSSFGTIAGGLGIGSYDTVNKLYEEERFNARQGHGFAAERANHLYDTLTGHKTSIIGDNNAKNGADRIVDGIEIQSKYCATGSRCIQECFEDGGKGSFRYYTKQGKPMQIEVPSDKYEAAVQAMEEKIRRGQVKGVTDPNEAKNIIRKGHFTYQQARNIAKAGTVESIAYDAVNGAITTVSTFGVTAMITFATSIWNGEDFEVALKAATYNGIKVGGTAFITSVVASQLSKAGLNSALIGSSEAIVQIMGPKASAMLINAFRSGSSQIYGAAAMKSAAKLLRGNVITSGVTVAVLSSFDVVNIFRGRISGKQLFKNIANTTATVAGGATGWIGGAAGGAAIGSVIPIVGTAIGGIVGGLIGSIGAGAVTGKVTNAVLDNFIEDDADEMVRILEKEFTELAKDYLLNQNEAEKITDDLQVRLDGKELKNMFASSDRREYAKNILEPLIEKEVSKRKKILMPTGDQMNNSIREILEEISDAQEAKMNQFNKDMGGIEWGSEI